MLSICISLLKNIDLLPQHPNLYLFTLLCHRMSSESAEVLQKPAIEFDPEQPPEWNLQNISRYNNFYVYNRFLRTHYFNPQKTDFKRTQLDFEGEDGLMDPMCECTSHIRQSECKQLYYGALACHNRAITTAKLKQLRPNTEVCDTYYFKLHKCLLKNKIPLKNPDQKN